MSSQIKFIRYCKIRSKVSVTSIRIKMYDCGILWMYLKVEFVQVLSWFGETIFGKKKVGTSDLWSQKGRVRLNTQ